MNSLTPQTFENLLDRLDPDRNRAAHGYELLRRKLVKFFERNKCLRTEELADETIDRVAKSLESAGVRDVGLFAYGVARMVCLEANRNMGRFIPLANEEQGGRVAAAGPDPEKKIVEELGQEKYLLYLKQCLDRLPVHHKQLIVGYYNGEKQLKIKLRQEIARRRGISIEALRSEANAIRDKLRSCVNKHLKGSARRIYRA